MEFKLSNLETEVDEEYAKKLQRYGFKVEKTASNSRDCWRVDGYSQEASQLRISFDSMAEFAIFLKEFPKVIFYDGDIIIYDDYFE